MRRILAVSSGGGHWAELMIVSAAFEPGEVVFATTEGAAAETGRPVAAILSDCNRNRPLASLKCFWQVVRLMRRLRPSVVVSTGAAPGLFAIALGKLVGARTVWIDSVANAERLSASGRLAGWVADLWLTQWRHLAEGDGPRYMGSVL